MISIEKKKRHTSGSRSKSRKSKPNQFSVQLKPHKVSQTIASHEHTSKQKTENSLNKSKGSHKLSKQNKKKSKNSKTRIWEQSKQISRPVSAQRKNSIMKMNRTQANFEQEDLDHRIYTFKKTLSKIERPSSLNTRQIMHFYQQIGDSIQMMSDPIFSLLSYLHELYLAPINSIISLISPYEELLAKKELLNRSIQKQVKQNQQIYSKLKQQDLIIIKLKQKIESQRVQISKKQEQKEEKRRKQQFDSSKGIMRNMKKEKNLNNSSQGEEQQIKIFQIPKKMNGIESELQTKPNTKGLKIDLASMDRSNTLGFHDEFYSKIDEFSESWRNQALREKRF